MGITQFLAEYITGIIQTLGYGGVFFFMVLESMVFPVPSEAVMPFAGFLVSSGDFTFLGVIFWSTLGSLGGSLLSYYIGMYAGRPFFEKYGRYFLVSREDMEKTETFFATRGEIAVFIGRFIPVVRHLISIPAGLGKMRLIPFCIYTVAGAGLWNAFLMVVGFFLREQWSQIIRYGEVLDAGMAILFVALVLYVARTHMRRAARNQEP
ncbi:MAG: hypothetical protein A3D67_02125 [Candidatus Lloydbacteria bacterium RIFCSPHIGHO2_02_FULL_51_22]|uniref:VTT domain-containing protein n=2 Tax=Candidatus Lloydiibacteriota TaxID=1817910 RepID=A0A1G2D8G3_9BACT|nr:MAG: hypothetical protein A3D67_02125 [Candidatus Lloydbacteria bacterium RIFCSPHIGHO2_02_FULL_51_22]OGZ15019.1 MAG: hypothetical protein A3J08_01580 [Candidatus Lloydbacteria bacterium RIFCSPLOWO2_02_FULL_51_11]